MIYLVFRTLDRSTIAWFLWLVGSTSVLVKHAFVVCTSQCSPVAEPLRLMAWNHASLHREAGRGVARCGFGGFKPQ